MRERKARPANNKENHNGWVLRIDLKIHQLTYEKTGNVELSSIDPEKFISIFQKLELNHFMVFECHPTKNKKGEYFGDPNPHIHVYFKWNVSRQAVVKKFKVNFPCFEGNGMYSLKEVGEKDEDRERLLTYLCKGQGGAWQQMDPCVYSQNGIEYMDEWIKTNHILFWLNNQKYAEIKNKRQTPLYVSIENRVKKAKLNPNQIELIGAEVYDEFVAREKPFTEFDIRKWSNITAAKLDFTGEFKKRLLRKAFE